MQATIQSTSIYIYDPTQLQSIVLFDDGSGTTFTRSYLFPVGSDPLEQINADLANYNAAADAVSNFATTVQTAIADNPGITSISVDQPVQVVAQPGTVN